MSGKARGIMYSVLFLLYEQLDKSFKFRGITHTHRCLEVEGKTFSQNAFFLFPDFVWLAI